MTAVLLMSLLVALALILAITWIEPRVLGGPVPRHGPERSIEPVNFSGDADPDAKPQAPGRLDSSKRRAA